MLQLVPAVERHDQDAYRCPVCRSLWYEDELKKLNEHALRPYWQDELPPEGDDDLG